MKEADELTVKLKAFRAKLAVCDSMVPGATETYVKVINSVLVVLKYQECTQEQFDLNEAQKVITGTAYKPVEIWDVK
jgi:hypothetical protein